MIPKSIFNSAKLDYLYCLDKTPHFMLKILTFILIIEHNSSKLSGETIRRCVGLPVNILYDNWRYLWISGYFYDNLMRIYCICLKVLLASYWQGNAYCSLRCLRCTESLVKQVVYMCDRLCQWHRVWQTIGT